MTEDFRALMLGHGDQTQRISHGELAHQLGLGSCEAVNLLIERVATSFLPGPQEDYSVDQARWLVLRCDSHVCCELTVDLIKVFVELENAIGAPEFRPWETACEKAN